MSDKYKVELPCLPEGEFSESVIELTNKSGKNYTVEVVPPINAMSGLTVNPLVKPIEAGKSTLVSIKFDSKFRDLTYKSHDDMMAPKTEESVKATGLAKTGRNKRLEEKIRKQREEREAAAGAADPKAKGNKAAPGKDPKKEEKPAAAKGGKKTAA